MSDKAFVDLSKYGIAQDLSLIHIDKINELLHQNGVRVDIRNAGQLTLIRYKVLILASMQSTSVRVLLSKYPEIVFDGLLLWTPILLKTPLIYQSIFNLVRDNEKHSASKAYLKLYGADV